MPHLAPTWLTVPRVTMAAIAWVPPACAVPIVLSREPALRALLLLAAVTAVEVPAAWVTVRALGRSFDRRGRSWVASFVAHTFALAAMIACIGVGRSDGPVDSGGIALYLGILLVSSAQLALMVSLWTSMLVAVASMRPRAASLNAADRTLALLGVIVAVPCAIVTMFGFTQANSLGAICTAVTVLPLLAAAAFAALRVRAWRRWLAQVRTGEDARWRITAVEGERGTLCAVDAPAQPFREAEILIPVAFIDRR